ncbi:MAG: NAD(P)/FAD-dependent oxidoreductase [Rhodospirillaceae bacterium]
MTETRCDVLIIGMGPAGARAAEAAAQAGRSVIALDRRKRAGFPVQCAEFVPTLLGQELDGLGAVTAQPIDEMVTYVSGETPHQKPHFPGNMISRDAFDAGLVKRAEDAGADCRFGIAVADVAADGAVRLTTGDVFRGRVLIGCDGPRSRVGRACGRVNEDLVETRQVTVPLLRPHSATDIFLSADIPGGYGWLFPKGDIAHIGAGVTPTARDKLKAIVDDLHQSLMAEDRVGADVMGHTGGAIPVGGMLDPVSALGDVPVLLAGDAAGLANPVTGAGIASAAQSGRLAGEAAAKLLAGDAGAAADYAEELEDLFKPALDRALKRRRELLDRFQAGGAPGADDLRRGWIAYPEYWAA